MLNQENEKVIADSAPRVDESAVTLAPMTAEHLDTIIEGRTSAVGTGEFQWFGHRDPRALRRKFDENGGLSAESGMLSVLLEKESVGEVFWFASAWGPAETSTCWSIAIGIAAEHRGRGIGSRAQALLVEYLLAHTRVERVQAWTDAHNIAEQRALLRAGFTEEGTLRSAQWRGGSWHDQKLFSRLRGE